MWPNPQDTEYLVTFTDEIINGELHFLYSVGKGDGRVRRCLIIQYSKIIQSDFTTWNKFEVGVKSTNESYYREKTSDTPVTAVIYFSFKLTNNDRLLLSH